AYHVTGVQTCALPIFEAGIKTGKGAAEGPSGALALLGTPSIDASKAGGRAGLKAEGFAGAEAGGALSGAVEWLPPADFGKNSGRSEERRVGAESRDRA